ncbi:hypothetical protein ACFSX9_01365 [Flavobacterium ardleyense]|uniref:Lipoprotein n=1 Tax=Flavobacterium ardleyense TaxID=2038737 RepID=A0ABW5Z461_9FLAO
MKQIFSVLLLLVIFSCGRAIGENSIQKHQKHKKIVLPYGDKDLLYAFPKEWTSGKKAQDSIYNKLQFFVFEDENDSLRESINLSYLDAKLYLDTKFVLSNQKENIEFKTSKLFFSNNFEVFSIIYKGKIDCGNCEFPESQIQNMLVSMSNNKIIDKLLISSVVGNDLGQSTRYFYIDTEKTIHLKDFNSDEEGTTFLDYSKYKINNNGKFIPQ